MISWRKWFSRRPQTPARTRSTGRVRPHLELLEDRLAPASKIWTGASNANWNVAGNWIGGVPGASDIAVFDTSAGGTNANSTVNAGFAGSVAGIQILNYNGTITDSLATLNVGASGYTQSASGGGIKFSLGSNAIVVTGNWSQSSGAFSVTSGTISVAGNFSHTGGTFTAGTGTVILTASSGTQTFDSGGIGVPSQFNNISHTGAGILQIINNNVKINGTLTNDTGAGNFDANGQQVTVTGLTTLTAGSYLAGSATQSFNGGLTINGGTLTGAGGDINAGDVTLSSGTLTAPSGAFNVSGNWSKTGGTFTPGSNTVTFTKTSGTQTLDSGGTAAGSQFNNISHTGAGVLDLANNDLKLNGAFTNNGGNFRALGFNVTIAGLTTLTAGSYIASAGTQNFDGGVTINGGTLLGGVGTINAVDVSLSAGTLTAPSGTFNVAGNWSRSGAGTFTPGSNTVTFTKAAAGTQTLDSGGTAAGSQFNNISHTGTGILQVVTNDLQVNGTLTNASGAGNFDANGRAVTVTGLTTLTAGSYLAKTGTQSFNGGLTINGGTLTGAGGDINAGDVTLSSGTLTAPSGAFNVAGNWSRSGAGTFTPGSNTVTFTKAAAGTQTLDSGGTAAGSQFNNISHTGTGILQVVTNDLQVNGTLTNASGAGNFDANGRAVTVTGLTTLTAGSYLAKTGTQSFNGGLTINGGTFTGAGGAVNAGDVTLSSGTLTAPSGTFNVAGNWSRSGTGTFTPGSNTVTFTKAAAGTQTLDSGGTAAGSQFNNISHTGTGILQVVTNDLQVNGTLTNASGAGNFDANGRAVTVTGLTTLTAGSYLAGSATQTFTGGLTINGGNFTGGTGVVNTGDLDVSSGSYSGGSNTNSSGNVNQSGGAITATSGTWNVSGNWTRSGGTFDANGGAVALTGTNQSISGSTTFHNFTKTVTLADTLTFASGAANKTIVTGTLTLHGASGQLLSLRSDDPSTVTPHHVGTQWQIDPQGTRNVSFVDVQDSKNVDTTLTPALRAIRATDSVDSGHNTKWNFISSGGAVTYNLDGESVTLVKNGTNLELRDTATSTVLDTEVLANVTSFTVNGADDADDSLTIDYSIGVDPTGDFFAIPVTFHGGANGTDSLAIHGGAFQSVIHTFTTAGPEASGNIVYDVDGNPLTTADRVTIVYDGLSPVDMTGSTITDLVFNLPGANDQAILEDDANPNDNVSEIKSQNVAPTFDTTSFTTPTGSLTVNMGADSGTFTVADLDAQYDASLIVNGEGGANDVVTVTGTLALGSATSAGVLTITAEAINLNNASISTNHGSAAGGGDVTLTGDVTLGANVVIDSDRAVGTDGNVDITGTIDADDAVGRDRTLTVTAGTGTATFGGAIGTAANGALADLDVTAATINLNGGTVQVDDQGGNTVTFTGAVVLGADTAIDTDGAIDNSVTFTSTTNGTASGAQSLTISAGNGAVTLGAVGTTTALEFVTITTTGLTTLGGNIRTDNNLGTGNVDLSAATGGITLGADITINSDAGGSGTGGAVNLSSSAVNGTAAGAQSLTITAGNGAVTLPAVGTTTALEFVTITTTGVTTLGGNLRTDDNTGTGNVNLSAATGGITLGADITINSDAGGSGTGGAVNLSGSAVNGTAAGAQSLTITAGDGAVTLAAVGTTTALEFVTITTTGLTTLGGNIRTDNNLGTGNVDLSAATGGITLSADITINSDAGGSGTGGAVNLSGSAVNGAAAGAQSLTITAGNGAVTLPAVGTTTALEFVTITTTGLTTLGGNIRTDNNLGTGNVNLSAATGGIVLSADITINSDAGGSGTGGAVNLSGSTVNGAAAGAQSLTITAGNDAVALPAVGTTTALEFVTITTTGLTTLGGNIRTDDNLGTGNVNLSAATGGITLTADITINSDAGGSGTGGAVNLSGSTVNGTAAGAQSLAITAGNGAVTLGAAGTATALEFVTITTTGLTTLNGNLRTDNNLGTGNVNLSAATGGITLGADITINSDAGGSGTGGAVNLSGSAVNGTAAGAQSLTISAGNGAVTLGAVGTTTALEFVTITTTGLTTLGGNVRTDNNLGTGNVNLSAATGGITLTSDTTINSDAGGSGTGGAVNLSGSAVNGTATGAQSLTITAGNGAVTLGALGTTTALEFVTITTTGPTTLGGNIRTDDNAGTGNVNLSAATGGITLSADITINSDAGGSGTGGAVNLSGSAVNGTAAGAQSLTITAGNGAVTLGAVGTATALEFVKITTTGVTTLGGNIRTDNNLGTGDVNLSAATGGITLGADITINSDAGGSGTGGAVNLSGSAVNGALTGAQSLTITAGNGAVTLATVGTPTALEFVTITTTGLTTLGGNVTTSDAAGGTGAQTYNSAVSLGASVTLTGTDVTFNGTLNGNFDLQVNASGITGFNGVVGGSTPLASITTNLAGSTHIGTGVINTQGGTITFNDPVVLTADTVLTDSGTTGIFFNNTVNSDGTARDLTAVTTNAAAQIQFNGTIGGLSALDVLTIDDAGAASISAVFAGAGSSLVKNGAGTLTLTNVNTYTGTTTINAGIVSIAAESGLGTTPGAFTANQLTLNGGTLEATDTFSISGNRGVTLLAGGGAFDVDATKTLTINSVITGAGSLTKTDLGALTLSAVETYSGATNINAGTLKVTGTLNSQTAAVNVNTGGLALTGGATASDSRTVLRPIVVSAAGAIVSNLALVDAPDGFSGVTINVGAGNLATIVNTNISGNKLTGNGAGIRMATGDLNLISSSVNNNEADGNSAANGNGGGIFVAGGVLNVINSTISGNRAQHDGGGIFHSGGLVILTSSTVAFNQADSDDVLGGTGGGVFTSAGASIGAINSIFAENQVLTGADDFNDIDGALVSFGNNLVGKTTGFVPALTDIVLANDADALLADLALYGGLTPNHALLPGSPALDAGLNAGLPSDIADLDGDLNVAEALPFDQRGLSRVVNGTVDIGAFESSGFTVTRTVPGPAPAGDTKYRALIDNDFLDPLDVDSNSLENFGVNVSAVNAAEPILGGRISFTATAVGGSTASAYTPVATITTTGVASASTAAHANLTPTAIGNSYELIASAGGTNTTFWDLFNQRVTTLVHDANPVEATRSGDVIRFTPSGTPNQLHVTMRDQEAQLVKISDYTDGNGAAKSSLLRLQAINGPGQINVGGPALAAGVVTAHAASGLGTFQDLKIYTSSWSRQYNLQASFVNPGDAPALAVTDATSAFRILPYAIVISNTGTQFIDTRQQAPVPILVHTSRGFVRIIVSPLVVINNGTVNQVTLTALDIKAEGATGSLPDVTHTTKASFYDGPMDLRLPGGGLWTLSSPAPRLVQSVRLAGSTTGSFSLTFNGQTASFAATASATTVRNGLNALSSIGGVGGSVTVTLSSNRVYTITFGGTLTNVPLPLIVAAGSGGTLATAATLSNVRDFLDPSVIIVNGVPTRVGTVVRTIAAGGAAVVKGISPLSGAGSFTIQASLVGRNIKPQLVSIPNVPFNITHVFDVPANNVKSTTATFFRVALTRQRLK